MKRIVIVLVLALGVSVIAYLKWPRHRDAPSLVDRRTNFGASDRRAKSGRTAPVPIEREVISTTNDDTHPEAHSAQNTPDPSPANAQPSPSNGIPAINDYDDRHAKAVRKIDKGYSVFLKQMEMSGKDAAKMRVLLIEREMVPSDIFAAGRAQGYNVGGPPSAMQPLMDLVKQALKDNDRKMKEELGIDDYKALQVFRIYAPEWTVVDDLCARLEASSFALTEEQRARVVEALYASTETIGGRNARQVGSAPEGYAGLTRIIPPTALDNVRPILSPQQMEEFVKIYNEQQRRREWPR